MTIMTILDVAQHGNYFASVANACGMSASEAKSNLEKLCPAIARQLKSKAQNDGEAFEALLDLLDEGGGGSDLDNLTDSEAIADGKVVLEDIYGSPSVALAEMKRLVPGLVDTQYDKISAIAATSVLAVLARTNSVPATLADVSDPAPQSGGLLQTIISAVLKGIFQSLARRLAPRRRRRRSYSDYFGTRRRRTTRRRTRARTPTLEDIFGQILGTRKN
jgi:hypothetical protein